MKLLTSISLFISFTYGAAISNPEHIDYEGYQVHRISTGQHLKSIQEKLSSLDFDQWNSDIASHIDIVLPPSQLPAFSALNIPSHCMHSNLGASIKAESAPPTSAWKRSLDDLAWYDSYHSYDEHVSYFDELHAAFPENSELVSSGTSFEGRDIFGLHFWGKDGPGKPAVLWHGTVHAREWITAPVIEFLTLNLIQGYKAGDNYTQSFVDNYDFWVFPFVNPDGFIYTQTTERLWRKNRQPPPPPPANQSCIGRDINRNWAYEWDGNPLGASTDPCTQVYRGEAPSDSPENKGLTALVDTLRDTSGIKLYVDWHSYGQYILAPWGYNCTLYADDLGQHINLAGLVSTVIREVGGKTFTFGPSCGTLYATTGSSVDYIYGAGKADWSYTIELRDTGDFGFVLPPDQIRVSVEEQWQGMQVMLYLLDEVFFDGEGPAVHV
ncbi:hypothetical protein LTR84_005911 [Exophiala bonariae]|uniref:Peptidase M14 domain-containing protein n=1 Tax=Exophiala bonariae TaxID=1690606 RepID=A0AAV9N4K0_9EURO|nr:hypothetical protein LTR84_005911 [Exophiala bonariae]